MQRSENGKLELRQWLDPAIVAIAFVGVASGFGQFGAVAALGDVAKSFGRITHGTTIADQAGLSGTSLGIGLAVLRLASLGALPLTGLADRFGRRRMMLTCCALGLAATVCAAASPGYWWFVAIFALGRPLLSTSNALGSLAAAEHADAKNRARAVALVTAGYGIGAGATAVLHSLASSVLGFRNLFAIAVVPLVGLLFVRRSLRETDRYLVATAVPHAKAPLLGVVGGAYRRRLQVLAAISFAVALTTGPATSFVFIYAQNVRGLRGTAVAAMVLGAGVAGLAGLVTGGWLADHVGRRPTGAAAMIAMSVTGMAIYSGSVTALIVGYIASVFFASNLAPPAGSLVNELFPTEMRGAVAGWLVVASVLGATVGLLVFGAVADVGGRFSTAAILTFVATIPLALLFTLIPETRGLEPEQVSAA